MNRVLRILSFATMLLFIFACGPDCPSCKQLEQKANQLCRGAYGSSARVIGFKCDDDWIFGCGYIRNKGTCDTGHGPTTPIPKAEPGWPGL